MYMIFSPTRVSFTEWLIGSVSDLCARHGGFDSPRVWINYLFPFFSLFSFFAVFFSLCIKIFGKKEHKCQLLK